MFNNYLLKEEHFLDDTGSEVQVLEHIKTKAKVLLLNNNDENNVFSIGFRTPPSDDTGVPHIVEHCTLSGSRKYRTREPFMDLIKSSLQTFLNAMTYPDKTLYPVSSRNKKDFMNLMDVYLDSVFFPRMYEVPEIFYQEGWHLEYDADLDSLSYNGVVYNEMKGVYSDPDSQVSAAINKTLHPNSSYGFESGGAPLSIPKLTYEDFLDFHKKFYHPSNSYIYLYGSFDKEELLDYIDREYLSSFEEEPLNSFPIVNPPFSKTQYANDVYNIGKEEDLKNKTYYCYSVVTGNSDNGKDMLMRSILTELLVDSETAILKESFLAEGFGEDIYSETSSSYPLDFSIIVKNAPENQVETFQRIIDETLTHVIQNKLPRKQLESILKKIEFSLRKGDGPHQGIIYFIRALNSWLYDQSPFESLTFQKLLKNFNKALDSNYFEECIERTILNNPNKVILTVSPDPEKSSREEQIRQQELLEIKNSLSMEERNNILAANRKLIEFQMTEDSKEAKATIPHLQLEDVSPGISKIKREIYLLDNHRFLIHPHFTNGISYFTMGFPLNHLKNEDLPYVSLISELITRLSTKKKSYSELDTELFLHTGGIRVSPVVLPSSNKTYHPMLLVSLDVLNQELEKGLLLLKEVLLETRFNEEKRIRDILFMLRSEMEANLISAGHVISMDRLKSHYNEAGYYSEQLNGLDYYFFIKDLLNHWEERKEETLLTLEKLASKLFNVKEVIGEFTGDEKIFVSKKTLFSSFLEDFPSFETISSPFLFQPNITREGLTLPSEVQFVSVGYQFPEGFSYNGSLSVLSNILSTNYLHDHIRAKGGAYGAGIRITQFGDVNTYSYRDPNLMKTLEVYNSIPEFVETLQLSKQDLQNFIIGTMNAFDPLLTPAAKGLLDFKRYITGIGENELEQYKQDALSTTTSQLREYAPLLKDVLIKNNIVVIGKEELIRSHPEIFTNILSLK